MRKSIAQHVKAMARGILVLDENLFSLSQALERKNIRIIKVESGMKDEFIQKHTLPGRIFVTNNSKDFVKGAKSFEYGIISTENIKSKDPEYLSDLISKEIIKNKLWSKLNGFILTLRDSGKSSFKELKND